jgi:hypothetical protein
MQCQTLAHQNCGGRGQHKIRERVFEPSHISTPRQKLADGESYPLA